MNLELARHCSAGHALLEMGQVTAAAAEYGAAVELGSENISALDGLGRCLAILGRLPEATEYHRRAAMLAPDSARIRHNFGCALMNAGSIDNAIEEHRAAVRLAPCVPAAHKALARTLHSAGRLHEAIDEYHEAIRFGYGDSRVYRRLGSCYSKLRGYEDEAELAFRRAIRFDPRYTRAHCELGDLLLRRGARSEARLCFEEALRLDSQSGDAQSALWWLRIGDLWPGNWRRSLLRETTRRLRKTASQSGHSPSRRPP